MKSGINLLINIYLINFIVTGVPERILSRCKTYIDNVEVIMLSLSINVY